MGVTICSNEPISGSKFRVVNEYRIPMEGETETLSDLEIWSYMEKKYPCINPEFKEFDIIRTGKYIYLRKPNPKTSKDQEYYKDTVRINPDNMQSPIFDVFTHHNMSLDVWGKALKEGKMKPGGTLLHFDTHADMISKNGNLYWGGSIADYINMAAIDGTFSEIYWILPDWTKERPKSFWRDGEGREGQDKFLSNQTEYVFWVKGEDGADRKIVVHKVIMRDLPSFENRGNVSVDVDMDYFSNSGYDTTDRIEYNLASNELPLALNKFSRELHDKKIKPDIVTVAKSPKYTPEEDVPVIERYFRRIYGSEYIEENPENYNHGI